MKAVVIKCIVRNLSTRRLSKKGVFLFSTAARTMVDCIDMVSSASEVMNTDSITMVPQTDTDDIITIDPTLKDELQDDTIVDAETGLPITSMPPSLANPTIQGLLSSPGLSVPSGQLLTTSDGFQIIAVNSPSDMTREGQIWQVVHPDIAAIIAVNADQTFEVEPKPESAAGAMETGDTDSRSSGGGQSSQSSQDNLLITPLSEPLPPDAPLWAQRMKKCEKIGDSYRGCVDTEVDLDLLLTYHKQQTQSFWGTRQSPCPAKPSTRLMWKSQYVPFDGVPFVNSGSRAVVMECQYGPRRRGNNKNKLTEQPSGEYKQTCPARIYIKKVKKFAEFAVDTSLDKKSLKAAMDNAFHQLKMTGINSIGQEMYYVQLPTEKAHEYHDELRLSPASSPTPPEVESEPEQVKERLDPRVRNKIRELVAGGETRVYAIRKQLRSFVTKVLYMGTEVPERHDLTLFPTVNDLKNQIHQALRDVENGTLVVTPNPQVNVEIVGQSSANQTGEFSSIVDGSVWTSSANGIEGADPVPETVTVTLTQKPGEDGHHVISRIETHLSDGSTRISSHLTPETAQLLSRLHPNMFPSGFVLPPQDESAPPSGSTSKESDFPLKEDVSDNLSIDSISQSAQPTISSDIETHDIESLAVIVNSDESNSQPLMVSIDTGILDNAVDPPSLVHHGEDEENTIENQLNCVGVMSADSSEISIADPQVAEFQPVSLEHT